MESVDKLRTYARGYELYVNHKLLDIADVIEQEVKERYIPLPMDADGKPIYVGDWITGEWDAKAKVEAVTSDDVYWWEPDGCHWCHAFEVRHYEPTVEDVLREVVTLCHNTWKEGSAFHFYDVDDVMESGNIAEFAKRLRLAGDVE